LGELSFYIGGFIMGIAGSLHCLGMCGPIFIASAGFYDTPGKFVLPLIYHHTGKIFSYMAIGVVMGLIGKSASILFFQNQVMIFFGAILILTSLFSFIRLRGLTKLNKWVEIKMGAALKRSGKAAWMLGLINGLVPCGLVYAAALGSAATQSIYGGAVFMVCFGLGTIPSLTIAGFSRWLIPFHRLKNSRLWRQIPAAVLGCWLLLKGLGLGVPYISPDHQSHAATRNCCKHHNPEGLVR
jgi:sulfite exporter TauE/SafE